MQQRVNCDCKEDGDGDDGAENVADFDGVRDEDGERNTEERKRGESEQEDEFGLRGSARVRSLRMHRMMTAMAKATSSTSSRRCIASGCVV